MACPSCKKLLLVPTPADNDRVGKGEMPGSPKRPKKQKVIEWRQSDVATDTRPSEASPDLVARFAEDDGHLRRGRSGDYRMLLWSVLIGVLLILGVMSYALLVLK
jgi:hypothetical protein